MNPLPFRLGVFRHPAGGRLVTVDRVFRLDQVGLVRFTRLAQLPNFDLGVDFRSKTACYAKAICSVARSDPVLDGKSLGCGYRYDRRANRARLNSLRIEPKFRRARRGCRAVRYILQSRLMGVRGNSWRAPANVVRPRPAQLK